MNTLYLHIGTHKTATTTIQRFCADNRSVLESKGIVYPDFPFRYPFKGPNRNGLFMGDTYKDANGVRHKDIEEKNYKTAMGIIHELFQTHHGVLLSNERMWIDLYKNDARLLRRVMEDSKQFDYQIRMIIYLRRQDQYIESLWSQQIKERPDATLSLQDYIQNFKHLDYYKALSVIADLIGEENITVCRFSDVVKGEGILSDFMHHLGLELTDEYVVEQPALNPGIYGNVIEIKRIINTTDGLERKDMRLFIDGLPLAASVSKKAYPCGELSVQERTALMESLEESNNAIQERFIGDGQPLFSTDYSNLPKREENNPEFIRDIIRSSAATDVLMYRRIKAADSQIKKLEKQIKDLQEQFAQQEKKYKKMERAIDALKHPLRSFLRKLKRALSR